MKQELRQKLSQAKRDAIKTGGGIREVEYDNDAEMEFLDHTIDIPSLFGIPIQ